MLETIAEQRAQKEAALQEARAQAEIWTQRIHQTAGAIAALDELKAKLEATTEADKPEPA